MSLTEIMTQLPQLTREQREDIASRIAELDGSAWVDPSVSTEQRAEIERRLLEIQQGGVTWSTWDEARARIEGKLRAG